MLHNVGFLLNGGFSSNLAVVCISEIRLKQALFLPIQRIFSNHAGPIKDDASAKKPNPHGLLTEDNDWGGN